MSTGSRARPLKFAILAGFIVVATLVALVLVALAPWKPDYPFLDQWRYTETELESYRGTSGADMTLESAIYLADGPVFDVSENIDRHLLLLGKKGWKLYRSDENLAWFSANVAEPGFQIYALGEKTVVRVSRNRPATLLDRIKLRLTQGRHG